MRGEQYWTVPSCMPLVAVSQNAPCKIAQTTYDGFGHQLAWQIMCDTLAELAPTQYSFIPTRHTRIQHSPKRSQELLGFLSMSSRIPAPQKWEMGSFASMDSSPCDADGHSAERIHHVEKCNASFASMPQALEIARTRLHERLHAWARSSRLSAGAGAGGTSFRNHSTSHHLAKCTSGQREKPICLHVRGYTRGFERENWLSDRIMPASYYQGAIRLAEAKLGHRRDIVVHTNDPLYAGYVLGRDSLRLSTRLYDEGGNGDFILEELYHMVFCCDALVGSWSSLSSVATMASLARLKFGAFEHDDHFNTPLITVAGVHPGTPSHQRKAHA